MPRNDNQTADLVIQIAAELGECRQRGIEKLDQRAHNQTPIQADLLQGLASDYVDAKRIPVHGRIAQVKTLLRHALDELSGNSDEVDASLIRDLFFGDSVSTVFLSAGELLRNARRKRGEPTEARFREQRRAAFEAFAVLLVRFVQNARTDEALAIQAPAADDDPDATAAGSPGGHPLAGDAHYSETAIGYVGEGEIFVSLLADALEVTIIGFTNEHIAKNLEAALRLKRLVTAKPDAFWNSLRIVYLSTELLDFLDDERSELPNRKEAVDSRRLAAAHGRQAVRILLRKQRAFHWDLYDTPYVPPIIGTLFEMPNGTRLVQLLIPRPQRRTSEHLYVILEDPPDHYFKAAFEDIVSNSTKEDQVVVIGQPANSRFRCTGSRYRHNILIEGSNATGWIPVVLVATYQRRADQVEPLLQLRTRYNADREIDRLSHLSGHIYQEQAAIVGTDPGADQSLLGLQHELPAFAAMQRVKVETDSDIRSTPQPVDTGSYLHHAKENLFFFIYSLELPEEFEFPGLAGMYRFPLADLLAVRENQALRKALELIQAPQLPARTWTAAAELAALNLILHDHGETARLLTRHPGPAAVEPGQIAERLTHLEERTRQMYFLGDHAVELGGLGGFQYREFFTVLLPLYERAGVSGAAALLDSIRHDAEKVAAVERISAMYHDVHLMSALPVEL